MNESNANHRRVAQIPAESSCEAALSQRLDLEDCQPVSANTTDLTVGMKMMV